MIGSTLDKYEVLQKVGEGGMATVYRGRHATLDRSVAIKVLHPHLSSSTRNRKRFAREARAIEHLRHDNILEIFDYSGLDAGDCYIITEFVEGDTLTALLRSRGRLPSEVVAIVGLKLAHALAYAHHEGILHRDLKPDNVMIRLDGTVKLMDFGIARFLDESQVTMTGALVGSPAFMSPEQAREGNLDHRSDLFSLGTMMFYLVCGSLPFTGSNASLILKNVIESNRPSVSELAPQMSATLADVIERLMATNPDDRFNHAGEVATALEAVLAESNVDPDEERWSMKAYLDEPEAYELRLQEHLTQILLLRGKERLASGDHLAALRLFNRLLAIDEDNPEVLELVQGLHDEPEGRVGGTALLVLALAMGVLGLIGFAWVYTQRANKQAQQPSPEPTSAMAVAPEPQPALAPEPAPVQPAPTGDPAPVPAPAPPAPDPRPATPPAPEGARVVTAPRPVPEPDPALEGLAEANEEPATIRVINVRNELFGRVRIDGNNMGFTRAAEPYKVRPGTHTIEVHGRLIKPWSSEVTVAPGEEHKVRVNLEPLPQDLQFARTFAETCVIFFDGSDQGNLASHSYAYRVTRPEVPHRVRLECPDREPIERTYASIVPPTSNTFEDPA